jgi:hypothetical protein
MKRNYFFVLIASMILHVNGFLPKETFDTNNSGPPGNQLATPAKPTP